MKKALVLSLAAVLGLGFASFAQTLTGSWDTNITIDPSVPTISIASDLVVTYAVSGWSFTSITAIDNTGWQEQSFEVGGALGAFTIGTELVFDPIGVAFESWEVTSGLNLAGVAFGAVFTLEPNVTSLVITGSGSAGLVTVGAELTLGDGLGCNFNFSEIVITVDFPFCCAEISSEIAFNCADGFEYVEFSTTGIQLPGITWATLDAVLTFTVDEKTLVVTPSFDFGAVLCFDVYLSDPATLFGDIEVVGLGISCEIGGVEFTGLSYWGDTGKPAVLGEYWEMYTISTTDDGCCGPFSFDISVFFLEGGTQLFDVAYIESNFDIQISSQFTFGMGLALDLEAVPAFAEWTLHFLVEW
jgi:hypothetical protein